MGAGQGLSSKTSGELPEVMTETERKSPTNYLGGSTNCVEGWPAGRRGHLGAEQNTEPCLERFHFKVKMQL